MAVGDCSTVPALPPPGIWSALDTPPMRRLGSLEEMTEFVATGFPLRNASFRIVALGNRLAKGFPDFTAPRHGRLRGV